MSQLLFSVLAATSLAASGIGTVSETRSAQSLPAEHLAVTTAQANSSGNFHSVNRLADTTPGNAWSDQSAEARCKHHGGHWNAAKLRCEPNPVIYLIGGATLGGFIYAITSHDHGSSGQPPISN